MCTRTPIIKDVYAQEVVPGNGQRLVLNAPGVRR